MRFKELDKAKDRLNHVESNILTKEKNNQFFDFKKNIEYSTLWDDKKLLAKKNDLTPSILQNNNPFTNQNLKNYGNFNNNIYNSNPYNYRSSAQYGAFFQNNLSQPI